jgi:hypothetical protein
VGLICVLDQGGVRLCFPTRSLLPENWTAVIEFLLLPWFRARVTRECTISTTAGNPNDNGRVSRSLSKMATHGRILGWRVRLSQFGCMRLDRGAWPGEGEDAAWMLTGGWSESSGLSVTILHPLQLVFGVPRERTSARPSHEY